MPGTYRKRGKESYYLEVCIGTDYTGKPLRYSKTVRCKSDRAAEKELAKFYAQCEAGNYSRGSRLSVGQLCDLFMDMHAKHNVKKSTYSKYGVLIRNQIKPYLGNRKAAKVTARHLQSWVNDLYASGLSNKSVHCAFSLMRTIFTKGVIWGELSSNPCLNVTLRPLREKEADFYNRDEVITLLEKLADLSGDKYPHRVSITLSLFTGLRASELSGLKWEDVDWENRAISVNANRAYVYGFGVVEDTPKTTKSRRRISLPLFCVDMLKEYQLQQKKAKLRLGTQWVDSGYIFVTAFGAPSFPRSINKWFSEFIEEEGLRKITLHQLRHTHTSILDYIGVKETEISKRLGHSQLSTTRNRYTHIFHDAERESSDKLDDFYADLPIQK